MGDDLKLQVHYFLQLFYYFLKLAYINIKNEVAKQVIEYIKKILNQEMRNLKAFNMKKQKSKLVN